MHLLISVHPPVRKSESISEFQTLVTFERVGIAQPNIYRREEGASRIQDQFSELILLHSVRFSLSTQNS
jgi:hypothetical protein